MKCFSAAATVVLAAMLCGCQQKADMTPVWQTDLPTTGVHMELSNTDDISFTLPTTRRRGRMPFTTTCTRYPLSWRRGHRSSPSTA